MAAVLVAIANFMKLVLPPLTVVILAPMVMTAMVFRIPALRKTVEAWFDLPLSQRFKDDPGTVLIIALWFAIICQLFAAPFLSPNRGMNLRMGKFTNIGVADIPDMSITLALYLVLPCVLVHVFYTLTHCPDENPDNLSFSEKIIEIVAFILGFTIVSVTTHLITAAQVFGSFTVAGLVFLFDILSKPVPPQCTKIREQRQWIMFTMVFLIVLLGCLYFSNITTTAGEIKSIAIHIITCLGIPLAVGAAMVFFRARKNVKRQFSFLFGVCFGMFVGVMIQTALPDSLRPPSVLRPIPPTTTTVAPTTSSPLKSAIANTIPGMGTTIASLASSLVKPVSGAAVLPQASAGTMIAPTTSSSLKSAFANMIPGARTTLASLASSLVKPAPGTTVLPQQSKASAGTMVAPPSITAKGFDVNNIRGYLGGIPAVLPPFKGFIGTSAAAPNKTS